MRHFLAFSLTLIVTLTAHAEPLRVLFIGNSFTYISDLPQLTVRLAESAKPPREMKATFIGEGGATLERLWKSGEALATINSAKWDYVVLQEQGTLGSGKEIDGVPQVNDPKVFHAFARKFDAEIRKAGAKTLFFMTWARQDAPQSQEALTNAYESIAKELGAKVAPAGIAWQNALSEDPKLVLHYADRTHPAIAGSYLTACVLYAVLFESSPVGLSSEKVPDAEALILQRVAWKTVHDGWRTKAAASAVASTQPVVITAGAAKRGREVLAKAQKAAGGLDRLRALHDISVTFTGEIFAPGNTIPFEGSDTLVFPVTERFAQKYAMGEIISVVDGDTVWRKTATGIQDPVPDMARNALRAQLVRNTFKLLREDSETTVAFEQRARINDREADVILITTGGESVRFTVDAASGSIIGKAYRGMGTGGPADIVETLTDFRDVSGVQLPFHLDATQNGAPFLAITLRDVRVDTGVTRESIVKKPE